MSNVDKVESETHYLKLIGKEDFNSLKPARNGFTLDLDYFVMEAHNHSNPNENYKFLLESYNVTEFSEDRYVEGQLEGIAIACRGSNENESESGELRVLLKSENVHRLRFAVSPFTNHYIDHFEFYDPSGKLLGSIEGRDGWIDFQVPFEDSMSASISQMSIFFEIYFGSTVVDSFELWQWTPYQ